MMAWSSSTRRARLPKDWEKRRQAVKRRAKGKCQGLSLNGEARWHAPECDGIGRECDHITRGDDHRLSNLQWLSTPCHKAKTQAERPKPQPRAPRRRPAREPHPNSPEGRALAAGGMGGGSPYVPARTEGAIAGRILASASEPPVFSGGDAA